MIVDFWYTQATRERQAARSVSGGVGSSRPARSRRSRQLLSPWFARLRSLAHLPTWLPQRDWSPTLFLVTSGAGSWSSRPLGIVMMFDWWSVGPAENFWPASAAFA